MEEEELSTETIAEELIEYEKFLKERVGKDYSAVVSQRDEILEEIKQYETLKMLIEELLKGNKFVNLKAKVDLGCNVYANAKIPDASRIYVKVGFGFFVEFELQEAIKFIERKLALLQSRLPFLEENVSKIQSSFTILQQGIAELRRLQLTSS